MPWLEPLRGPNGLDLNKLKTSSKNSSKSPIRNFSPDNMIFSKSYSQYNRNAEDEINLKNHLNLNLNSVSQRLIEKTKYIKSIEKELKDKTAVIDSLHKKVEKKKEMDEEKCLGRIDGWRASKSAEVGFCIAWKR